MALVLPDFLKCAVIRVNRFPGTLERMGIVTNEDRLRLLGPRYRHPILVGQQGQDRLGALISANKPLMVSRLGLVELSCLRFSLERRHGKRQPYPQRVKATLSQNAGFFPTDDASLDAFSELYLAQLPHADVMTAWLYQYEDVICGKYCRDAELIHPTCLEPFWFTTPWSGRLAGRKVLVVYPFAESIRRQYAEKRRLLFASPDILPEFELKTLQAVQSIAGSPVPFSSWFQAYRHMCDEMASIDFDICLIGAGAYGLPLAAFAKSLGKQAIHLGGITQLLFGIKGRRWEELYADTTAQLFNEHWIRPLQSETPAHKDIVENGCYW